MEAALERASREKRSLESELERYDPLNPQPFSLTKPPAHPGWGAKARRVSCR
jgi:hypothetical protein